jgi:hypothetical protein
MRFSYLASAALLVMGLAGQPASATPGITGDYIETRSCNVYAGACHAEGEATTAGRQAMLAWNVRQGVFEGVSIDGVKAVALVAADRNVGLPGAQKQAVLYLDRNATPAQQAAMEKMLREKAGDSLGKVLAVKTAEIAFDATGDLYQVSAPGVATLKVKKEPGPLCCIQKYQVWYKPFVNLKESKIGYSVLNEYRDATLKTNWSGSDQNNAYFGEFSL